MSMLIPLRWISATSGLLIAALSLAAGAEDKPERWQVSAPDYTVSASPATIDVTEGTWMSLDVAPDGRHIVFDLLGDIYQIPFTGGQAELLRAGHAWEIQPQYSPDGQSIAFTSDIEGGDNIWVMDLASRTPQQITYESFRLLNSPSWHPNGEYIVARKHFTTSRSLGTGEIWMYHIAGAGKDTAGVPVIERADPALQKELGEPTFAPDGESIYYTLDVTPGNTFIYHQDSNGELFQIREVDLTTGEVTTAAGGAGGAVRPTPSPDGRYLAYIKRVRALSRLFLLDLTSGEETMLVDAMDQDMQETWAVHGLYPTMDWTPDSQQLVYWAAGKLWRVAVSGGEPVNIPFEVNDTREIYPAPLFTVDVAPTEFATRMVRFARPSPDGRDVVFESLGRLYVKTMNQPPRLLTRDKSAGHEFSPVWSKDGKQVYFLRWDDQQLASIHAVKRRGGKSIQLNEEKGQYSELSLSVDGTTLVYRKDSGGSFLSPNWGQMPGIYLLDIQTRTSTFVVDKGNAPYLGADNRVYVTDREVAAGRGSSAAMTQLLSMTRSGFDERVVVQSELAKEWLLSPDGQYLAFIENQQVYVSVLPMTGKTLTMGPKASGLPTVKVSQVGGKYLSWSPDSSAVSWSTGPEFKTVQVNAGLFMSKIAPDDRQAADASANGNPNASVAPTPDVERLNLSQQVKADMPDGQYAITGARLITMDKVRRVIENGTLLIEGNRIVAMGASEDVSIAAGVQRLDAQGKTIIPGLIDIHAHGAYASGEIIPQQNWQSLAHLALGVTTLHNPSSRADQVFAAAEYARVGLILSPRIFSTGEIVYGAKSTSWAPVDSLDDALSHVRRLKAQGAISIKNYNQPRRDQRQQVIEAARQEGLMSVAEGGSLFNLDMSFIADGITGVEHNVPTLVMYNDVTQFWRQSQSGYTPTLVVTYNGLTSEDYFYQATEVWKHPVLSRFVPPSVLQPRSVRRPMAPESDYKDDDAAAAAKVLMEAGVVVNTGGHGQREGLATHWEMWSFVRGGMSPMQALSAATINPATYMGMDADLGSLEVGKLADLVILDANPLDNIRDSDQVSYVVINGRVYQGGSLQEVLTGDKSLRPFWWQNRPQDQIR